MLWLWWFFWDLVGWEIFEYGCGGGVDVCEVVGGVLY